MRAHALRRALCAVPVVVPLQIHNGFPVLTAKIDGKALPVVFDTGGDFYLTLSESALQGLRTVPLEKTYAFSDAKGNILRTPMFEVPRLEIGAAVFTDVEGHVDISHPTYPAVTEGREGMIGVPLLLKYKVVLDYPHGQMTLIAGEDARADACTGAEVPFLPEGEGSSPVTSVATDAGELKMVWDTGAPLSMIRKGRAEADGLEIENATWSSAKFQLAETDFGPQRLHVLDYVEPAGTDGFVGYTFFAKNVVCIDFPHNRLFIAK